VALARARRERVPPRRVEMRGAAEKTSTSPFSWPGHPKENHHLEVEFA
jgi:hypothetical protein